MGLIWSIELSNLKLSFSWLFPPGFCLEQVSPKEVLITLLLLLYFSTALHTSKIGLLSLWITVWLLLYSRWAQFVSFTFSALFRSSKCGSLIRNHKIKNDIYRTLFVLKLNFLWNLNWAFYFMGDLTMKMILLSFLMQMSNISPSELLLICVSFKTLISVPKWWCC